MPSTSGLARIAAEEDEVRTTLLMDFWLAAASSIARVALITPLMTLFASVLSDRSEAYGMCLAYILRDIVTYSAIKSCRE
jgi:hypothetical protein